MSQDGFFGNVTWEGALAGGLVGYLLADTRRGSSGENYRDAQEIQVLRRGVAAEIAARQYQTTPDMAASIIEARMVAEQRQRRARDAHFAARADGYLSALQWLVLLVLVALSPIVTFFPMLLVLSIASDLSPLNDIWDVGTAETLFIFSPQLLFLLWMINGHLRAAQRITAGERRTMHRHVRWHVGHCHDGADRLHIHPNELADPPQFLDSAPDATVQPDARLRNVELKEPPSLRIPPRPGGAVPGWYQDPAGRFDSRYWDGASWTDHVLIEGRHMTDAGFYS